MITDQAWCPLSAFLHVYNCCKKSPDLLTIGWSAFAKVLQDLKFKYLSIYFENKLKNLCSHMMKSMQYTIHFILKYKDDISPNRTTCDTKWGMKRGVHVVSLAPKSLPWWHFLPEKLALWALFACAPNLNLILILIQCITMHITFLCEHLHSFQQCAVSFVVEFSVITKRALVGGGPIETDWDRFEFQYFLARCLRETCASNRLRLIWICFLLINIYAKCRLLYSHV